MLGEYLVQYGEVIGYVAVGVIALLGLGIVQLMRRRGDVKRARIAVRLVTYSISEPRPGPIAVTGSYRESQGARSMECKGQRVVLEGPIEVVRGTRARWQGGVRTYSVRDGEVVIALGVMSRAADGWRLVASPGEDGIQVYAAEPAPAPPPLFPWRAPLILAVCGGIAFGALYQTGKLLVDVPRGADGCSESSRLRLEIAAATPVVRDEALTRLAMCGSAKP
jgi:hypothetical protein